MSEVNPYASPMSPIEVVGPPPSPGNAWGSGQILVVAHNSNLPGKCIKCNESLKLKRKRLNLAWISPWYYILLFFALLLFVIVALILQKKMQVELCLCSAHRSKRRNAILVGWLGTLGGIALIVVGAAADNGGTPYAIIGGLVLFWVTLFYGVLRSRIVWPQRIDKTYAWLKGASPQYLLALPEFHE